MNIPFLSLSGMHGRIREEMHQAFSEVYDSHWWVLGRQVEAFERSYAAFNQVGYCVGLSNGLDALHLSLKVLGVTGGDEVIVPSNTYIATVLAISYTGADPVFAERAKPEVVSQARNRLVEIEAELGKLAARKTMFSSGA